MQSMVSRTKPALAIYSRHLSRRNPRPKPLPSTPCRRPHQFDGHGCRGASCCLPCPLLRSIFRITQFIAPTNPNKSSRKLTFSSTRHASPLPLLASLPSPIPLLAPLLSLRPILPPAPAPISHLRRFFYFANASFYELPFPCTVFGSSHCWSSL